jgi:hypothetical protein
MPQIVDCIAVSEPIPVPWPIGWAPSSKATHSWGHLGGGVVAADAQSIELTRQMLMLALRWNSSRPSPAGLGSAMARVSWPRRRQSSPWVMLGHQQARMGDQGRMGWCLAGLCGQPRPPLAWRGTQAPTGPGHPTGRRGGLIASWRRSGFIRRPHVVVVTCRAACSSAGLVGHAWTSMGNDVTPCQVTVTSSPLPTSSTVSS